MILMMQYSYPLLRGQINEVFIEARPILDIFEVIFHEKFFTSIFTGTYNILFP